MPNTVYAYKNAYIQAPTRFLDIVCQKPFLTGKLSMNRKFLLALLCVANFSQQAFALAKLPLQKKTLELSGSFTPTYRLSDFSELSHELLLKSQIGVGYFIKNNLSLGLSIPAKINVLPAIAGELGLSFSGTYFFETGVKIYPYLGLHASPYYSFSTQMLKLVVGPRAGILLGLNEYIALDLGFAPELDIRLNNKQKWRLNVPVGLLGVRAFF